MQSETFEIAAAVIASVGGGAAIVFAMSSWLGKVWANRILESEKAKYQEEIIRFKSTLQEKSNKTTLNYKEKIELYKIASAPLVELAALIDSEHELTMDVIHTFDKQRLHITSQLALFAPLSVFNSFNELIDYVYNSIEDGSYQFSDFRIKALELLSEIRKDIGIYSDSVSYNGSR